MQPPAGVRAAAVAAQPRAVSASARIEVLRLGVLMARAKLLHLPAPASPQRRKQVRSHAREKRQMRAAAAGEAAAWQRRPTRVTWSPASGLLWSLSWSLFWGPGPRGACWLAGRRHRALCSRSRAMLTLPAMFIQGEEEGARSF